VRELPGRRAEVSALDKRQPRCRRQASNPEETNSFSGLPWPSIFNCCSQRRPGASRGLGSIAGRIVMPGRHSIAAITLAAALSMTIADARAFDETKYPDWKGQWIRTDTGIPRYDPSKPAGRGQQAPLTPEYQSVLEASLADQAAGGQGTDPTYTCLAPGLPRIMNNYEGAEFVITPETTHILMEHIHDSRRIYTDGRAWPAEIEPSFAGYSIGKWIDEGATGRYNLLEIESRGFKGPRSYDNTGLPLHPDNQSIIKERIFQDKADPSFLYDEITTTDHALTRPWTATKKYRHVQNPRPVWRESVCAENNPHVEIAKQGYMLSADGLLMPAKKDQVPPDLKYFNQTRK
jgi:hypothetical protein